MQHSDKDAALIVLFWSFCVFLSLFLIWAPILSESAEFWPISILFYSLNANTQMEMYMCYVQHWIWQLAPKFANQTTFFLLLYTKWRNLTTRKLNNNTFSIIFIIYYILIYYLCSVVLGIHFVALSDDPLLCLSDW